MSRRFEPCDWQAEEVSLPDSYLEKIASYQLKGRVLNSIYIIGHTEPAFGAEELAKRLTAAGVPLQFDIHNGYQGFAAYPHLDRVPLPRKAHFYEPLQLVFQDGLTLELLPRGESRILLGANSIPAGTTEGVNHSNLDANALFSPLLGETLRSYGIRTSDTAVRHVSAYSEDYDADTQIRRKHTLYFDFGPHFCLEIDCGLHPCVKATGTHLPALRYGETKRVFTPQPYPALIPASGNISVAPTDKNGDDPPNIRYGHYFMVDEIDFDQYLYHYFAPLFDPAVQLDRYEYSRGGFDHYDSNYYTAACTRNILAELRDVCAQLETKPPLSLRYTFADAPWMQWILLQRSEMPANEWVPYLRQQCSVALDFYRRFIERVEIMLSLEGTELICFEGP